MGVPVDTQSPHRILLVGDLDGTSLPLRDVLGGAGYAVSHRQCREPALLALKEDSYDLVLLRACGRGMDGLYTLAHAGSTGGGPQFIVLGDADCIETGVLSMRLGAFDCVKSTIDERKLLSTVRQALERAALFQGVGQSLTKGMDSDGFGMIGTSEGIRQVRSLIRRVAPTMATVLLTGETGTGKEVAAGAIHRLSKNGSIPFVPVSCAALPEPLLESELFGHRRGSFTGAVSNSPGLLERASGGTLFLDEVETLTPAMQGKLLRAVEEKTIQRVGSSHDISVDFRLIAATNKDLGKRVRDGLFREDLFFRLNVFPIEIPPLRQRRNDIPLLAAHFCGELAREAGVPPPRISSGTMNRLMEYTWPGNVRELKNYVERAFILLEENGTLEIEVPPGGSQEGCSTLLNCLGKGWDLRQLESEYILAALQHTSGHRSRAADLLGIDRRTLYRKIREIETEN